MTAKLARWYFAFILAIQLITFANCQTRPVSVCNLQGLCTCDSSLPEKATAVNCDCAKAAFPIENLHVTKGEYSFPRSLKTIRISNCDSLTVADNVELPDNISELLIKSVKDVAINLLNFRKIANLTIQDVPQLEIMQKNASHTLYADNILFRNVSMKCQTIEGACLPTPSKFTVSTRFEAIDSHFGTNAEIDIVASDEKRLSVIITNCTAQTFRAGIAAHSVEMKRNRFNEVACDVINPLDLVRGCKNTPLTFTGSLKLAENYYKNMMMPDLVIDGRNITLDLYPDRKLSKNSTNETTARAAQRFLLLVSYRDEDDGRVPPDDRVVNERRCRTTSLNVKPKYRNSTRQYTCTTSADLMKQINSDDFLSDFTNNFAAYLVSNSPSLPSHLSISTLSLVVIVVALLL